MVEEPILAIDDLRIAFPGGGYAVRGVSLTIGRGEVVGVAGQSGSGKTVTALAAAGLLPEAAQVDGSIRFDGRELLGLDEVALARVRGNDLTMIFQETVTALNPVVRVGRQMRLAVRANCAMSGDEADAVIRRHLRSVGLEDTDRVLASYPSELSGGMCQRVMIAMALSCGARLLLADEPTTALDVSVQRDVLDVLSAVVREHDVAVMFVSHDLGVLEEVCDRIVVMYEGEVVETGPATQVVTEPLHPYTQGLIDCLPHLGSAIVEPPSAPVGEHRDATGCRYASRCPYVHEACVTHPPLEPVAEQRTARCWLRIDPPTVDSPVVATGREKTS